MRTERCEDCYQEWGTYTPSAVVFEGEGYCGDHACQYVGVAPVLALEAVEAEVAP